MDWYLDTTDAEASRALREEFRDYLTRHAEPGSDLAESELVFAEVIANAMEHTAGGVAWVSVDWSGPSPVLSVRDLGNGFELNTTLPDDPFAEGGRGLFLVAHLSEELEVVAKRAGGSQVTARLPVRRRAERSHEPPRRNAHALPDPEEADASGAFGKEPFLRALVVELAKAVELQGGPDDAEAAVAQVGTNVGGRMEDEYRRAHSIVGTMTPQQIADLYVGLKRAIQGDFYVVECTDERIVLGNRACPFGEVVQRAPALCRMTSSVFGGIAARNTGEAVVQLEERIAVGDHECRVVVWLGRSGAHDEAHLHAGHRYTAPAEPVAN